MSRTDEGRETRHRGPRFRIDTLMILVAAAALLFQLATGSGVIPVSIVFFVGARLALGWRARSRRAEDKGLVVLGASESEVGDAMVYAVFALVLIALLQSFG